MPEIFRQHIEEQRVEGKPLGRHVHHDERSREHVAEQAATVTDVEHACHGALPLNQGELGSCTGNACVGAFDCDPNFKGRGLFYERDARWIYWKEVELEGYPQGDDVGGSGVEVCKAARNANWITGYSHTFDFTSMLQALVLRPGLMGSNWYTSMDAPDENGVVSITAGAQIRGGHEYLARLIDTENQLVGFVNSWGPDWGVKSRDGTIPGGCFYMSYATVERLLSERGDYTVPLR